MGVILTFNQRLNQSYQYIYIGGMYGLKGVLQCLHFFIEGKLST